MQILIASNVAFDRRSANRLIQWFTQLMW